MKPDMPALERYGVRLRLLEANDLPLTLAWRNRDDVRQWFFSSAVIDDGQHRGWFEKYRNRADDLVFIIEETERLQRPVGQVSLYSIDHAAMSAEFGRLMIGDPEARGAGLGLAATRLAMEAAFGPLALRSLHLEVAARNERAIGIYRAAGFSETHREGDVITMVATVADRT